VNPSVCSPHRFDRVSVIAESGIDTSLSPRRRTRDHPQRLDELSSDDELKDDERGATGPRPSLSRLKGAILLEAARSQDRGQCLGRTS
jgi:hypothetical protein